jgi:hypothetical protein
VVTRTWESSASARRCLASMAKAKIEKTAQNQRHSARRKIMLTSARPPLKGDAVSLSARTLAGHSGWWSESGARGQGLVTSALGRLRDNARPALRPVCESIAGLGQAGTANHRLLATSQEARLEPNGGVGSLPQEPRWNAGRRSAPRKGARRTRMVRRLYLAFAGVPPALFLFVCFLRRMGRAKRNPSCSFEVR